MAKMDITVLSVSQYHISWHSAAPGAPYPHTCMVLFLSWSGGASGAQMCQTPQGFIPSWLSSLRILPRSMGIFIQGLQRPITALVNPKLFSPAMAAAHVTFDRHLSCRKSVNTCLLCMQFKPDFPRYLEESLRNET